MLYATKAGAGPTPFKRVPQFLVTLLQPAGVPAWVGSIAVGQLETAHQRRAARSRHQLLQTLHKNSWAFSSYVVRPYNSEKTSGPRACSPQELLLLWLGTRPQ